MHNGRALVIGDDITFTGTNGRTEAYVTPAGAFDNPNAFIKRLSQRAKKDGLTEMTVILERSAAAALGFPSQHATREDDTYHPILDNWRDDGWNVSKLTAWTTLWAPGRTSIHLGFSRLLGPKNNQLHHTESGNLAWRLARFHQLTGVAFHGNAGLAGMSLLRDTPLKRGQRVLWQPKISQSHPARWDCEKAFAQFIAPNRPEKNVARIGFDANRQYLAAARNVRVSLDELRHTGPREFDPKAAGYWNIIAPAWNIPELPNPSGYQTDAECWVTTDTMQLLSDLDDSGFLALPEVRASWTNSGNTREFLRPWADSINDAYFASLSDTSPDGIAVTNAIKKMYSWSIGQMKGIKARVARGDWHHATIAKARCNFYRRIFGVWQYMDITPDEIHYDTAWYELPNKDWRPLRIDPQTGKAAEAFPEGDKLGNFTIKYDNGGKFR